MLWWLIVKKPLRWTLCKFSRRYYELELKNMWNWQLIRLRTFITTVNVKGTAMQIEKALINDHLRVSKVL